MKKNKLIIGIVLIIALSALAFNYARSYSADNVVIDNENFGASVIRPNAGGTGTSTNPTFGQVLMGNAGGTYDVVATSTLGIIGGGGDVTKVGTPVDNQIGVWTGDGTIEGTTGLSYNGAILDATGALRLSGSNDFNIIFKNSNSVQSNYIYWTDTSSIVKFQQKYDYTNKDFSFTGIESGIKEIMTMEADTGYVGISNVAPGSALDVTGDVLVSGSIGATGARLVKGWFTDLTVTNAIDGSITGNAGTVSTITGLAPDTATTQATQPNITSLGTLTTLTVDNINLNGSTISATGDAGLALYDNASNGIFIEDGGNVGIGTTAPAYELDVDGFTNTKSIHEVSDEGLVLGMNFNTENNVGTAGSETVLDSSTYNNHGTNNGATHDPDGGFNGGGAFSFDGTNDYIDLGTNLIDWSNNWTISLWINPTGTGDAGQDVFESLDGNNGVRIQYDDITNGRIECFVGNGATTIRPSSTDITPNEWTEVVLNYDGTNSKLYMNGELKDTDAVVATNQTGVTQLGRFFTGTAEHYSGLIDNVKIYNRALSADEIKAQYLQRAEVGDSFVSQSDVFVDSSGNVGIGTVAPTSKLHTIQTETTGNALLVSRDLAAASTNSPLVSLVQDNAGDDQNALSIQNDGTGYGIYVDQNGNNRSIYVDSGATTAPVFTLNAANTDGNVVAWTFAGNHADSGNINFLFDNTNINSVVRNILIRQQGVGINTTFQNTLALAGEVVQVIQDNASSTADAQSIQNNGTGTCLLLSQTQDVEVIDFDACTDGGTSKTTIAGSLKIQMPNGSTGYINFYT